MRRLAKLALLGTVLPGAAPALAQDDAVTPAGVRWRQAPASACPCPPSLYPYFPNAAPPQPAPNVDPMSRLPAPAPSTPPNAAPQTNPPPAPGPNAPAPTNPNAFAQANEAGGLPARTFNENFDGDNLGVFYRRAVVTGFTTAPTVVGYTTQVIGTTQQTVQVPAQTVTVAGQTVTVPAQTITTLGLPQGTSEPILVTVTVPATTATGQPQTITVPATTTTTTVPVTGRAPIIAQLTVPVRQVVQLPLATRYAGVQITENDSPRPLDRVSFGYNFYSNAGSALNGGQGSDVQRQTAFFEKTFLDGDASIGLRMPVVQQYGPGAFAGQYTGDLTVVFKYAFLNDRTTGDLASAGLALTLPTGTGGGQLLDGSTAPHSVLFQPWAGFVKMFDQGYVQGITNLIVPTDGRDPTMLGNSLQVGYWLYRDNSAPFLTAVTPLAEVHVRTPFNDRNPSGLIYFQDQVNVTAGVNLRFHRAVLSTAVSTPLVGPRPWNVEGMGYLSFQF